MAANQSQCRQVAEILRHITFRDDFYNRPFISAPMSAEQKALMYFYAVGICHQTYALANPPKNLYGWDYLEAGFIKIFTENHPLSDNTFVARQTIAELRKLTEPVFTSEQTGATCTLDRLPERMQLLLDMALQLDNNHNGNVMQMLTQSKGLAGGDNGLYSLLSQFEAYRDPLRKKSSFLIKLLSDAGLFIIKDPENLVPVMDYHMQRVLLRSGCVQIPDARLMEILQKRLFCHEEPEIRKACIQAMKMIADGAGLPVLRLNDVFYMLGRSCCLETPLCQSGKCSKTPCSLTLSIYLNDHSHCLIEKACLGAKNPEIRKLWHPVTETHYY
jgi:hypothetical protein